MATPPRLAPPTPTCFTRQVLGSDGLAPAPPSRLALKKAIIGSPFMMESNQCGMPGTSLSCAEPGAWLTCASTVTRQRSVHGLHEQNMQR